MKYIILLSLLLLFSVGCNNSYPPKTLAVGDLVSCFKPTRQSSNYNGANSYPAEKAFDCRNQPLHGANFSHTGYEQMPWLEVDLQANYQIDQIDVINRLDNNVVKSRLKQFKIFVTNAPLTTLPSGGEIAGYNQSTPALDSVKFNVNVQGRYLRLWADFRPVQNWLHVSEIRVWGHLVPSTVVCDTTIYQVPVMRDSMVITCDTL